LAEIAQEQEVLEETAPQAPAEDSSPNLETAAPPAPGFVKHTTVSTKETMIPAGSASPLEAQAQARRGRKPSTASQQDADVIDWLDRHVSDTETVDWRLSVRRTSPPTVKGQTLLINREIYGNGLLPFSQVRDDVLLDHGGGSYKLVIYDEAGRAQKQTIFTSKEPVKISTLDLDHTGIENASGSAQPVVDPIHEVEEIKKKRIEAESERSKRELIQEQVQTRKAEREAKLEEMEGREELERRSMQPAMQELKTEFSAKIEQMKSDSDRKFEQMLSKMESLVTAIATAAQPKQDTLTPILAMMTEAQKSAAMMMAESAKAQATAMQISAEKNAEALKETAKIQAESAHARDKNQGMMMEKVFERAFNPPNTAGDMFKWMERGEQRTLDMMERIEDVKADAKEAVPIVPYNPEGSALEKIAAVVLGYIERKQSGSAPAQPQAQRPQAQAPQQLANAKPTGRLGVYDIEDIKPVVQAGVIQTPTGAQVVAQPQLATGPAPVPVAQAPGVEGSDERLRFYVSESMKEAVEDAQDGRMEQTWVEDALKLWNGPFLESLFQANTDANRMKLIQAQTDPAVYNALTAQVGTSQIKYGNFVRGLQVLMGNFAQQRNAAPGQAQA
jgi:hypothetical protein